MSGGEPGWGSLAQVIVAVGWRTFWQAGLVAAALFVAFRFLKRVPAGARMLLWWLVCLKFVLGLAWVQPIALPVLSPSLEVPQSIDPPIQPAPLLVNAAAPLPPHWFLTLPWLEYGAIALATLWLAGLMIQAPFLLRQLLRVRALRHRAHGVEGEIRSGFEALSLQAGLRRAPDLLASPEVETPHVSGLWRPTVLIPEDALTRWSPAELTMALGHELVHVRHKDLWHGLVPSIAVRLFFFHPLARLAAREYALAREVACDGRTLALTGAEPADYAQLLLRFGVTSRSMAPAVGGASKTFQVLKRRLDMLQDPQTQTRTRAWRWWPAAVVVALVALPFQLTARTDQGVRPPSDPGRAQQAVEAAKEQLQRSLEELRDHQRGRRAAELAREQVREVAAEAIEKAGQQQREVEAEAMERAKQQYQRELERTKNQWESAAREYERVTRQQPLEAAVEATVRQRQSDAEALQRAQGAANLAREAEMAALVRALEAHKSSLEQRMQETQKAGDLSNGSNQFLRAQSEQVKKRLDLLREQLERQTREQKVDLTNRVRERAASESQDISSRLRNVENEVRRLADLLEQLRDQLKTRK